MASYPCVPRERCVCIVCSHGSRKEYVSGFARVAHVELLSFYISFFFLLFCLLLVLLVSLLVLLVSRACVACLQDETRHTSRRACVARAACVLQFVAVCGCIESRSRDQSVCCPPRRWRDPARQSTRVR